MLPAPNRPGLGHRRGGDVTYHGPGQLVGYPILTLPGKGGGSKPDTVAYVRTVEQVVIDALGDLGLEADRLAGYPGVWVVKTVEARTASSASSKVNRWSRTSSEIRSTPRKPAWPSLVW